MEQITMLTVGHSKEMGKNAETMHIVGLRQVRHNYLFQNQKQFAKNLMQYIFLSGITNRPVPKSKAISFFLL